MFMRTVEDVGPYRFYGVFTPPQTLILKEKTMEEITREVLHAREGMLLTNGEIYCTDVYLKVGGDASAWREVPIEEAKAKLSANEVEGI